MCDMSPADPCELRLSPLTSVRKGSSSHYKVVDENGSNPDTCNGKQHHRTFRHASCAWIVNTRPATLTRAHRLGFFGLITAVRVYVYPRKTLSGPDRVPHPFDGDRHA